MPTSSKSAVTASNSSAWDDESNTATVVNRPLGPVQELNELSDAGYPAVQVGAGIVEVAAANSKYKESGLLKGSTGSSWHNLLLADSFGKVRFDDFSNSSTALSMFFSWPLNLTLVLKLFFSRG